MERKVALLRGINVGGRVLPMATLRALCEQLGCQGVQTYIQSGNVVFASAKKTATLEAELEAAIAERFGMKVPVIVRTAKQWAAYLEGNPFPDAVDEEPRWLLLLVAKAIPAKNAERAIEARGTMGERAGRAGDGLWIRYPGGVGTSKLSPGLIDKLVGSPGTTRNYRTAWKLGEMLEA
ncbi:MAG: DUF1697 domain-containing protein [Allosphingosinicella sp.]